MKIPVVIVIGSIILAGSVFMNVSKLIKVKI